jgi:hypothetical protein
MLLGYNIRILDRDFSIYGAEYRGFAPTYAQILLELTY